jgi:hypothetical protein
MRELLAFSERKPLDRFLGLRSFHSLHPRLYRSVAFGDKKEFIFALYDKQIILPTRHELKLAPMRVPGLAITEARTTPLNFQFQDLKLHLQSTRSSCRAEYQTDQVCGYKDDPPVHRWSSGDDKTRDSPAVSAHRLERVEACSRDVFRCKASRAAPAQVSDPLSDRRPPPGG